MTETAAQQHFRLPVDASPPPERLRWPMLLAVGAAVLVLHIALVTVFTPLAPEPAGNEAAAEHSALFVSSRTMESNPDFLEKVNIYDPIAFLHPPEAVGFSFFRATRDDFSLEMPSEPVSLPRKTADLKPLPPFEPEAVARPLVREIAELDWDSEVVQVPAAACPYCVADSRPDVTFPAIPLDAQTERLLQRSHPSRPSVFELRRTSGVVSSPADSDAAGWDDPRFEAILTESCGVAELDLAARAWLDTLVNSQEGPKLSPDDRCRVVWSIEALGKELSAR